MPQISVKTKCALNGRVVDLRTVSLGYVFLGLLEGIE